MHARHRVEKFWGILVVGHLSVVKHGAQLWRRMRGAMADNPGAFRKLNSSSLEPDLLSEQIGFSLSFVAALSGRCISRQFQEIVQV